MKVLILLSMLLAGMMATLTLTPWEGKARTLRKVAVGKAGVWGLDGSDNIFYKSAVGDNWTQFPGGLRDISVGDNEVWGVNSNQNIYKKVGSGSWIQIGGALIQVSVSDKDHVWGVSENNNIYRRTGSSWTQISGGLKCVSVGQAGVWGVNSNGNIYYRTGTYGDVDTAGTNWQQVSGGLKWISSGNGVVFGVNDNGNIYYRDGISETNHIGTQWVQVPGGLSQIDTYEMQVWGVNSGDGLYTLAITPEPCQLTRIEILSASQDRQYIGTKIIGISSGGSCFGSGSSTLSLAHSSSVEESIGIELSEESGIDWSVSVSVSVTAGFSLFGASGEVTVGLEVGVGGSKSYGKSESTSTSTGSSSEVSHSTTYTSPGAALTIGAVEKYSTNMNAVPVKQHFLCPSGKTYTRNSSIKLIQQHYEAAHFEDMRGTFYRDACIASGYSLPDCVSNLKSEYNGFVGDINELRQRFTQCFADGKGVIAKK